MSAILSIADVRSVSDPAKVKAMRYQIQVNMDDYISDRQYESRGRFGDFLLVLPTLQSITKDLIEVLQLAISYGTVKIDNLLQEMIIGSAGGECV